MKRLPRIVNARVANDYCVEVVFDDGFRRVVDLRPQLYGEVGAPLLDPDIFKRFVIDNGALVWPTGFDICPNYLRNYYEPVVS